MPALTTPIIEGRTATQYAVDVVHLDLTSNTFEIQVTLKDAQGDIIGTKVRRGSFATTGLNAGDLSAMATKLVQYLKNQGVLN